MYRTGWLIAPLLCLGGWLAPSPAQCPGCWDALQRAGNPQQVAPWARPSDTGRYCGYFVGGGCIFPHRADPPLADEGTWGWDFIGGFFQRRVILGWWHGRRVQGGSGAYQTDGPKVLHPVGAGRPGDGR